MAHAAKKRSQKKDRRPKKKTCTFCVDKSQPPLDYKDGSRLRKYVSERGKILPRRMSGNCARHQRDLTVAVKRARIVAFLPFVSE